MEKKRSDAMKKKVLSVIATAMSICLGMSFFAGCSTGMHNSSGLPKPQTEDEILACVLESIETSASYDGAYTYTMNKRTVDNTPRGPSIDSGYLVTTTTKEEGMVDVSAVKKLVKSEVDVLAQKGEEERTSITKTTYKLFQEKNCTISYTQRNETETYEILEDSQVKTQLSDLSTAVKEYEGYCQLPDLPSISRMNEAYATVYSELLQIAPIMINANGITVNGEASVSCKETEKGYVLTSTIEESRQSEGEAHTTLQTSIIAKEGKIVSLQVKEQILSDNTSQPIVWEAEKSYDISYTFNQEEYDKVQTAPPWHTAQGSIQDKATSKAVVDIYINGYLFVADYMLAISKVNGIISPLRKLEQAALNRVKDITWYSDPECTNPIEPTKLREGDFAQISALYAQGTVQDGYAFFEEEVKSVWSDDVSNAYKAVFARYMENIRASDGNQRYIRDNFYHPYRSDMYNITTFVNGELYSIGSEFLVETGAYYKVEHTRMIKTGYFYSLHEWILVR